MAQRVVTMRVSDLSGEDLGDGGQSLNFSIGNAQYTIDLSDKEVEKFFDTFKKYTDVAAKTGRGSAKRTVASGSGRTKEELASIRAWAKDNGHDVSERGRIKQEVVDAYMASAS
ncbi:MAG: Lsr2 family protein [Candidatus Saccharimonadales bacterium]